MADLAILSNAYSVKKARIQERLNDFRSFYTNPVSWFFENNKMELRPVEKDFSSRIFEELSFCLMTANTSAAISMKAVDSIRPVLLTGSLDDIREKLVEAGYRFPNVRANFIVEARENFRSRHNFDFRKLMESYDDPKELREFLVNEVKGLGYKEASHFLRNIGIFGLAILDKHIIRTLHEYGVINETPKSLNRNKYLEIEGKLKEFSIKADIDFDEIDLLLWSMKNGQIMK